MRQILTGCPVCRWRFAQPLEVDLPGYQHIEIRHLDGPGPMHIINFPPEIPLAEIERIRQIVDAAPGRTRLEGIESEGTR